MGQEAEPGCSLVDFDVESWPRAVALNHLLRLPPLRRNPPCHGYRNGCTCGACPGKPAGARARVIELRQPWGASTIVRSAA